MVSTDSTVIEQLLIAHLTHGPCRLRKKTIKLMKAQSQAVTRLILFGSVGTLTSSELSVKLGR